MPRVPKAAAVTDLPPEERGRAEEREEAPGTVATEGSTGEGLEPPRAATEATWEASVVEWEGEAVSAGSTAAEEARAAGPASERSST